MNMPPFIRSSVVWGVCIRGLLQIVFCEHSCTVMNVYTQDTLLLGILPSTHQIGPSLLLVDDAKVLSKVVVTVYGSCPHHSTSSILGADSFLF